MRGALRRSLRALALALPAFGAADEAPFTDVAAAAGLDFRHFNGMNGGFYFPEMTGPGCALADYDNDGDLDAYLVQGSLLGAGDTLAGTMFPPAQPGVPRDRLYRNDLAPGAAPAFVDVTDAGALRATGYGMGVASGDFDNDGNIDFYVTNFGANQLWRNRGDGTFADVTAKAGVDDPRWSTSAAFLDYDRDGWLDLYVANYVGFETARNIECFATSSRRDYCGPAAFAPVADRLFRNRGDGTFADATDAAGLAAAAAGAGLGVVTADFDGDGWIDIYVANDGLPNHLWVNRKDGTFQEDALFAGAAVNAAGRAEASMGVSAGDFDGDGDEDLFMAHLKGESDTLYVNDGTGFFADRTSAAGLASPSLPFTSFGAAWTDYDNDGLLDLFVANGAVRILERRVAQGDAYPLDQANQLFRNTGAGTFEDVSARAGEPFRVEEVSRGAAFGDVDNDGDTDVLVCNNNAPPRLLRNDLGHRRPWLGLRLSGTAGGRDMLGARVAVLRQGAPTLWRRVATDGSYASASDPRVLVGLGQAAAVTAVRVHWPDGSREQWRQVALGRYTTLRQGSGEAFE